MKTRKSPHLLGPKLDPKLTHFALILVTFCQHVYEDVSSSIFDGFWEASEPSFFDIRRSENIILTFLLRSLLASFSTPKTLQKSIKKGSQECFKRLLKHSWDNLLIDFWRVLGVENDANSDLNKNVKIVFSRQREPKNEGSEASQKPAKIDEETFSQTC